MDGRKAIDTCKFVVAGFLDLAKACNLAFDCVNMIIYVMQFIVFMIIMHMLLYFVLYILFSCYCSSYMLCIFLLVCTVCFCLLCVPPAWALLKTSLTSDAVFPLNHQIKSVFFHIRIPLDIISKMLKTKPLSRAWGMGRVGRTGITPAHKRVSLS